MTINETLLQLIIDCTTGDPNWDSKPLEWQAKAISRILNDVETCLEDAITFELDEFDAAQWGPGVMACLEMPNIHDAECWCTECEAIRKCKESN